jgi:hypothetical protein
VKDGSAPATTLFVVMMDVDPDHEEEFNRWYDEEHVPERLSCPGFLAATRYRAVDGDPAGRPQGEELRPRYLAVYELESPDVLAGEPYRKMVDNPSPWTQEMRRHYRVRVRNTYLQRLPGG